MDRTDKQYHINYQIQYPVYPLPATPETSLMQGVLVNLPAINALLPPYISSSDLHHFATNCIHSHQYKGVSSQSSDHCTSKAPALKHHPHEHIGIFQIFILLLSVYVIVVLAIEQCFPISGKVKEALVVSDSFICLFFFIDFIIRFRQAENKLQFMKWGWMDLLSSIPIGVLGYSRVIRIFKVLRLLKAAHSVRTFVGPSLRSRIQNTFVLIGLISVWCIVFGAICILQIEKDIDGSNIHTLGDAIWWAFVTVTTVGYGDYFPVTAEGRLIAAVLMTVGVGLFGSYTGLIASFFMEDEKKAKKQQIDEQLQGLQQQIMRLEERLSDWQPIYTAPLTGISENCFSATQHTLCIMHPYGYAKTS